MKWFFLIATLVLISAGILTWLLRPDQANALPVIRYVTDRAPARISQVRQFHVWQIESGNATIHRIADSTELARFRARSFSDEIRRAISLSHPEIPELWEGNPQFPFEVAVPLTELVIDADNPTIEKKLIHGVSGTAGDLLDTYSGQLQFLAEAGIVEDLTDRAEAGGYGLAGVPASIRELAMFNDRQYGFFRGSGATALWVNPVAFRELGVPVPQGTWTVEEFTRCGRAFVAAARKAGRNDVFFCDDIDTLNLARSFGGDWLDETLSGSGVDSDPFRKAFTLKYQWIREDRIIPSGADYASFATSGGGWGSIAIELFVEKRLGMVQSGSWIITRFRKIGELELAAVPVPYGTFPVALAGGATVGIYRGSRHPELAELFLRYLASDRYNREIIEDGDSGPPLLRYTESEEYRKPPAHPNEWKVHPVFADELRDHGIALSMSPFVLPSTVTRLFRMGLDEFMNDRKTLDGALADTARRIDQEIAASHARRPDLAAHYNLLRERQAEIRKRVKSGRKIPAHWIENPFYLQYYQARGLLEK